MVMKKKVWAVSVLEDRPFMQEFTSDFYTSDTDANLIIHLTDGDFNPEQATVTLVNNNDQSIVSEELPVKNDTITFPMYTEERNLIEHRGTWQFQIIYLDGGEQYTSKIISFSVAGYLLEGEIEPSLERVESWELVARQAEDMLADYEEKSTIIAETLGRFTGLDEQLEENEQVRQDAEAGRVDAEGLRATNEIKRIDNETGRQDAESLRATAEGKRLDNEILRADAENIRADNEGLRQTAETGRGDAEGVRADNETNRETAENLRQDNEAIRISNMEIVQGWLGNPEQFDGRDIEYNWEGTSLGVRLEGDKEYVYVDLKGDTGDIANLEPHHIETALGFTPKDYKAGNNIAIDNDTISVTGQLGLSEAEVKKVKVDKATDADTVNGLLPSEITPANLTANELTLGNYKLVFNPTENSLDIEVVE